MSDLAFFSIFALFFGAIIGVCYHKRRDIARALKSSRRYPLDRF